MKNITTDFRHKEDRFYLDAQGKTDYWISACLDSIPNYSEEVMVISATEETIYLTKEQAAKFFA